MSTSKYECILDSLGAETIARYDSEESGRQYGGTWEHEQANGAYTFSSLTRDEQIAILRAIDTNLPTKTARVNKATPSSYSLKHAVEKYIDHYTSNLQLKVAMRVLGFESSDENLNKHYNISKREAQAFNDLSLELWHKRSEARSRISKQREQQAAARYFHKMMRTA